MDNPYPWGVEIRVMQIPPAVQWCRERWGAPASTQKNQPMKWYHTSQHVWGRRFRTFYFADPNNAFEFKLRWY